MSRPVRVRGGVVVDDRPTVTFAHKNGVASFKARTPEQRKRDEATPAASTPAPFTPFRAAEDPDRDYRGEKGGMRV